jgi:hypothetical protein
MQRCILGLTLMVLALSSADSFATSTKTSFKNKVKVVYTGDKGIFITPGHREGVAGSYLDPDVGALAVHFQNATGYSSLFAATRTAFDDKVPMGYVHALSASTTTSGYHKAPAVTVDTPNNFLSQNVVSCTVQNMGAGMYKATLTTTGNATETDIQTLVGGFQGQYRSGSDANIDGNGWSALGNETTNMVGFDSQTGSWPLKAVVQIRVREGTGSMEEMAMYGLKCEYASALASPSYSERF